MRVKLSSVQAAQSAVTTLLNSVLPVKLSYQLSKTLQKFDSKLKDIEHARRDLVQKYGTADEKGGIRVPEEKLSEWDNEYTKYLDQEVDIDIWEIPLSKLEAGGVRLSPAQVISLENFIVDDATDVK